MEDHTKIDLKKSSYKKIGKLLETASTGKGGMNFIEYNESKQKGHKMIFKVYREQFTDFVP